MNIRIPSYGRRSDLVRAADDPDIVGREAEVQTLRGVLDQAQHGFVLLVLLGDAGIGKTALLHAAMAPARERQYRVLSCRPAEAEAHLSFAALADLLVDAIDDEVRDALPEPQRHALDVVLLLQSPGKTPIDERAISAAVLSTLRTLARRGPVVLTVDDLQWLDPASASALAFAIRRVQDRDQMAVIATVRSGEPRHGTPHLLEELAARGARRLEMGPLNTSALGRMIAQTLASELPINLLRKIRQVSRGNPLFAVEIARAIIEGGMSEEQGAPQLPVPADLQQTLRRRLSLLSPSARQALLLASAFAHPTTASISIAGIDVRAGMEEAVTARIAKTEGNFVRFTHPLFASVIYGDATIDERRSVHEKLAKIARDPEERARHLALAKGDPDAAVAEVVEEGARYARMRGATTSSAELFGLAAQLTPVTQAIEADRRRMEEAEILFLSGEERRASELMVPIVERSQPGPARAEALWRLARILFFFDVGEAANTLLEALEEDGINDRLRSRIHSELAVAFLFIGALQEAQRNAATGLELAESADPSTLAQALTILAWTRSAIGQGPALELLERAVGLENDIETFTVADLPSYALAVMLLSADELDRSRAIYERLLALSFERGDDHSAGNIHVDLSIVEFWSGNLDAAREHLSEPTTQLVREWSATGTVWALVQGCLGDVASARERAQDALATAERSGVLWDRLECYQALGFIELSVGDHEAAVAYLEPAWALHQQAGVRDLSYRFPADLAESLMAVGRADQAEPIVTWLVERGDDLVRGWAIGAAARCRGLLLAENGSLVAALDELGRAAEAHRPIGIPLELGRTLLTRGRIARRAKRKRQAREALEEAAEIFERLPAPLWAARARSELSRISGRRPSPGRLTPTEERIGQLAAAGRTNQEIADVLFVSVRTVESHLARMYAKLGVRSRTELAAVLQRSAVPT
jgi:DNA-binding CsgD family transcriptional regulator